MGIQIHDQLLDPRDVFVIILLMLVNASCFFLTGTHQEMTLMIIEVCSVIQISSTLTHQMCGDRPNYNIIMCPIGLIFLKSDLSLI